MNGFSAKATRFFQDLEDDNTREFWLANADVFEREVRQPMACAAGVAAGEVPALPAVPDEPRPALHA